MNNQIIFLMLSLPFVSIAETKHTQFFNCDGVAYITNGTATCNGVPMGTTPSPNSCHSEIKTACGYEKIQQHSNGGGVISLCAVPTVSNDVYISNTSKVCGVPQISGGVKIRNNSEISGAVKILGKSEIVASTISGASTVENSFVGASQISGAATLNNSVISASNISGAATIVKSILQSSSISGAVQINNSSLMSRSLSGAKKINNEKDHE